MPRRRYDLKDLMGALGTDKTAKKNGSVPAAPAVIDMTAPVLSLGQLPIPEENGVSCDVTLSRTPLKCDTESADVAAESKNGHGNGMDHTNGVTANGAGEDGDVKNGNDAAKEGLQLVLDVRPQSDFAYYAKKIPGLVNTTIVYFIYMNIICSSIDKFLILNFILS